MFQSCLICTDFSDGLYRLVDFVPSLSASGIKRIIFFHNVPLWQEGEIPRVDEEAIEAARRRLQAGISDLPSDVEVEIEITSGRPIENIQKVAKSYEPSVILTGMPIRSLLKEKLFGSTTAALARSCVQPLLILRPELISTYTREELSLRCQHLSRYLLIPYDGSDSSKYVVKKVKEYVQGQSQSYLERCMVISVVEDAGRRELPKDYRFEEAQEKIEAVKAELEQLDLQINAEVRRGNPLTEILDAALVYDISAIAVSSNTLGKGSIREWSTGSFAGDLIRRSWHPVLFFPGSK